MHLTRTQQQQQQQVPGSLASQQPVRAPNGNASAPTTNAAASAGDARVRWDGTLVMNLPAR